MRSTQSFSLEKHSGPYEKWPRETRLFFDGEFTGTSIPGFIIEAQYELGPGYLIITSQDCPFEESNDFVLLDRQFRRIAHRQLLVWYETFLLNAHWPVADDALVLHYHETLFFKLSVKRRFFGRGYRFGLRHIRRFENDARMKESVRQLRERLSRTAR
ncbi:hypothetical protein HNQ60_001340 [Povalibacter uvarum]|uniref:Uncharacterized protein n=1 Tax=Povalibacter uvarum TaxID=732238 RepID=A0A841HJZ8_9GAMM|nr:hypothetical protein [Povalibacter uvarum]MBB6092462.1 hypothetical protein [Povalibacter uvarum]